MNAYLHASYFVRQLNKSPFKNKISNIWEIIKIKNDNYYVSYLKDQIKIQIMYIYYLFGIICDFNLW